MYHQIVRTFEQVELLCSISGQAITISHTTHSSTSFVPKIYIFDKIDNNISIEETL